MKSILLILLSGSLLMGNPYNKDVTSLDAIISTLYEVISGEKGEARDWDRAMTPDDYINRAEPYLVGNGFFEREIGRRTETYRHVTHVFSTYDSRNSATDKKPFARGINSIQLMYDNNRWWIISILWNGETESDPLPQKYLRFKK